MAVDGIFITSELEGDLAKRVHAHQLRFDPRMANYLPPHITLIGSSGAGPIPPETPMAELQARIGAVAAATPPMTLRFGRPERFVMREIISLPLDPHGPIRTLHERLKTCGLPMLQPRYPFTPHCTLSMFPELTKENVRAMLAIREEEPFTLHTMCVYHTREPQPPRLLFRVRLGEGLAP